MTAADALVVDGLVAGYGGGDVLHERVPAGYRRAGSPASSGRTARASPPCSRRSAACCGRGAAASRCRGEPLTGKSPRQVLDMGVVHVPQNHSLFREMTVRENIELGGYSISDRSLLARRRAAVEEMFPDVAAWAPRRRAACPAGSSGWSSSPAA